MTSFGIVTVYHFGSDRADAYKRLIRGVRSTSRQLGREDRLFLVANGIRDAADPDTVLRDADPPHRDRIIPVVMIENGRAAGGLNVGMSAALRTGFEWIGPVQSSVVTGPTWLDAMRTGVARSICGGMTGRLTFEDHPDVIRSEGHKLKEGKTLDIGYDRPIASAPQQHGKRWEFPCLSACLFRSDLVRKVVDKYGDFVTERLSHYGDCTDVALRCASVGAKQFSFCAEALGTKRRPSVSWGDIASSQLIAAERHYDARTDEVRRRIQADPRYARYFEDAVRRAGHIVSAKYSPTGEAPPMASREHDKEWGADAKAG
jgi:hypothetical protein